MRHKKPQRTMMFCWCPPGGGPGDEHKGHSGKQSFQPGIKKSPDTPIDINFSSTEFYPIPKETYWQDARFWQCGHTRQFLSVFGLSSSAQVYNGQRWKPCYGPSATTKQCGNRDGASWMPFFWTRRSKSLSACRKKMYIHHTPHKYVAEVESSCLPVRKKPFRSI